MKVFIIETVDGILGVFETLEKAMNYLENVYTPFERVNEIVKYDDGTTRIITFDSDSLINYSYVISEYIVGEGRE